MGSPLLLLPPTPCHGHPPSMPTQFLFLTSGDPTPASPALGTIPLLFLAQFKDPRDCCTPPPLQGLVQASGPHGLSHCLERQPAVKCQARSQGTFPLLMLSILATIKLCNADALLLPSFFRIAIYLFVRPRDKKVRDLLALPKCTHQLGLGQGNGWSPNAIPLPAWEAAAPSSTHPCCLPGCC